MGMNIPDEVPKWRLVGYGHFNGKNYHQIHGITKGTKLAVAFANTVMAKIETQILSQNVMKPTVWKYYFDDIPVFSLRDISKPDIEQLIIHRMS